jgi:predicted nucleic acid-binding protein
LRYPLFDLDGPRRDAILADYLSVAEMVAGWQEPAPLLPRCRDAEDQKFLELARDGRADWLVTSDKALLKVCRRRRLEGLFRVLCPEDALREANLA